MESSARLSASFLRSISASDSFAFALLGSSFMIFAMAKHLAKNVPDVISIRQLEALKESQTNPRTIVEAARNFAKAAALFEAQGKEDAVVEMNSFLYWCKKKMNMQDMDAFLNNKEDGPLIAARLNAVESKKVEP